MLIDVLVMSLLVAQSALLLTFIHDFFFVEESE